MSKEGMGLVVVSIEPSSKTLILDGEISPIGWSPDAEFIYAIRRAEIIRIRANSPHDVVSIDEVPRVASAAVSPDGREIILSIYQQKSDVWVMENFDPVLLK